MAILDRLFFEPDKKEYSQPSDYSSPVESKFLSSTDGVSLHAWIFKTNATSRKGVVVQVHGNAENLTSHAPYVAWLAHHGFDVISWDYRGYGKSTGKPSKKGSVEDAAIMLKEGKKSAGNLPVIVIAQSFGAAVALNALKDIDLPVGSRIILEGAFQSFRNLAAIKLRQRYHSILAPLSNVLFSNSFNAIDAVIGLKYPLLSLHSESDEIIPIEEHLPLFEKCDQKTKTFWKIKDQKHLDAFRDSSSPYREKLVHYLENNV